MNKDVMAEGFKEVWALIRENAEQQKKTDEQIRATDVQLKETSEQLKETDVQLKKTDEKIDKLIGNRGKFVEGLVLPTTERLFKERGIVINHTFQRAKANKNGDNMEIDIFTVNSEYVVLIEAKSCLTVADVNEHLKRMKEFKLYFLDYKDKKVLGAVAGVTIEKDADRYAYKQGLFAIAQSGEMVKFLNDKKFVPK